MHIFNAYAYQFTFVSSLKLTKLLLPTMGSSKHNIYTKGRPFAESLPHNNYNIKQMTPNYNVNLVVTHRHKSKTALNGLLCTFDSFRNILIELWFLIM